MNVLESALAGRPLDRPLLAPRFAALAAEVEELPLETFLADLGRRARIYADLARSLRVDVLIVNERRRGAATCSPTCCGGCARWCRSRRCSA